MGQESPAARAGQIARQMMLYGRPIPNDEMMTRLEDITRERLTDLAGRLFFDKVPTLVGDRPPGKSRARCLTSRRGFLRRHP